MNDTDRELKHDDHDRDRDPHDATESGCRAKEGICSWRDARQVWIAHGEPSALRVLPIVVLSSVYISKMHTTNR